VSRAQLSADANRICNALRNQLLDWNCQPMTSTPSIGNGDFGMSPFCGQLSGKPVLTVNVYLGYRDQTTRMHQTFKLRRRPPAREINKVDTSFGHY
jgi:hypothetical protein